MDKKHSEQPIQDPSATGSDDRLRESEMEFTGHLNFSYPQEMLDKRSFDVSRLNRPVVIQDARAIFGTLQTAEDCAQLLTEGIGFILVNSCSTVEDWTDKDQISSLYYSETEALARRLLPEANILPIDTYTYRNEEIEHHHYADGIQYGPPALAVHNDYADSLNEDKKSVTESFASIVGLPKDKRIIGLNIWRSVSPKPLERLPLAICDRTSIDPNDLEYYLNPNAPVPFHAHYCKPNSDQRWYYYPKMCIDEALVFLTYDSSPQQIGVFKPTLHTAVDIPNSANLQPRQSIEIRVFAEMDEDAN
jgi:hypothetical protein